MPTFSDLSASVREALNAGGRIDNQIEEAITLFRAGEEDGALDFLRVLAGAPQGAEAIISALPLFGRRFTIFDRITTRIGDSVELFNHVHDQMVRLIPDILMRPGTKALGSLRRYLSCRLELLRGDAIRSKAYREVASIFSFDDRLRVEDEERNGREDAVNLLLREERTRLFEEWRDEVRQSEKDMWLRILEMEHDLGMSPKEIQIAEGIPASTFYAWRRAAYDDLKAYLEQHGYEPEDLSEYYSG